MPHLAAVARLRGQPTAGIVELVVGEADADQDAAELRAEREWFAAECEALAVRLAADWGPPRLVDLLPVLEQRLSGDPVDEPLRSLCDHGVRSLRAWTPHGRFVALGIGRAGPHLPYRLLAAAGEEPR